MSECKDASNLIDNEELDQEELEKLAFQNQGAENEDIEDTGTAGNPETNVTDNHLNTEGTTNSHRLKPTEKVDITSVDKNSDVVRRKSQSLKAANERAESDLIPNRGSLDLNKYIIKGSKSSVNAINQHVEAVATIQNAPNDNSIINTQKHYIRQPPVVNEPIIIIKENHNSELQMDHSHTQQPQSQIVEVPMRKSKIKLLQIFSIVAVVLFFPLGIPALYFANRIEGEFNRGILVGDTDKATKLIKRTEKLIIFSFIGAVLVIITILAVLVAGDERNLSSQTNPGAVMG